MQNPIVSFSVFSVILGVAASPALAEPFSLSGQQLDSVTAGGVLTDIEATAFSSDMPSGAFVDVRSMAAAGGDVETAGSSGEAVAASEDVSDTLILASAIDDKTGSGVFTFTQGFGAGGSLSVSSTTARVISTGNVTFVVGFATTEVSGDEDSFTFSSVDVVSDELVRTSTFEAKKGAMSLSHATGVGMDFQFLN